MRKSIAVIGSGIAGMASAWLLSRRYPVTLYESNDYIGGHTHTIDVSEGAGRQSVDTGFIVYNEPNYPNLTRLFQHLGVATRGTEMSFAASIDRGRIEYAGSDLNTLFAQRRNLVNGQFLGMLRDILRFARAARELLDAGRYTGEAELSLGQFLQDHQFGPAFRDHYLLPMAAAIWSCPTGQMLDFPAQSFVRFFENHGLLNIADRPQWRTVLGGSQRYVDKLLADYRGQLRCGVGVHQVCRQHDGVTLRLKDGSSARHDLAVLACHADQALAMLLQPSAEEASLLGSFRYQPNRAWLHCDPRLMPRMRRVWSSWNYLSDGNPDEASVSVTYWMNHLQGLQAQRNYFVSLNPLTEPGHAHRIGDWLYQHPVFDREAMSAQHALDLLQGRDRLWFCGSYFGYGFHEDALSSALAVADRLGVPAPWHNTLPFQRPHSQRRPDLARTG